MFIRRDIGCCEEDEAAQEICSEEDITLIIHSPTNIKLQTDNQDISVFDEESIEIVGQVASNENTIKGRFIGKRAREQNRDLV